MRERKGEGRIGVAALWSSTHEWKRTMQREWGGDESDENLEHCISVSKKKYTLVGVSPVDRHRSGEVLAERESIAEGRRERTWIISSSSSSVPVSSNTSLDNDSSESSPRASGLITRI